MAGREGDYGGSIFRILFGFYFDICYLLLLVCYWEGSGRSGSKLSPIQTLPINHVHFTGFLLVFIYYPAKPTWSIDASFEIDQQSRLSCAQHSSLPSHPFKLSSDLLFNFPICFYLQEPHLHLLWAGVSMGIGLFFHRIEASQLQVLDLERDKVGIESFINWFHKIDDDVIISVHFCCY